MNTAPFSLSPLALASMLVLAAPAFTAAQEAQLPSVVVSASKRGETLHEMSSAVSVAGRERLDDRQVTSTLELDRVFPELHTTYGGTLLFPSFVVRGMTSIQDLYSPALTVYVDGVPQLATFATQSLLGVEQVELLKGPQGTLYGRSAQGGVLNIVTRKPDDTPHFSLRTGLSSPRGHQVQAEGARALVPDTLYGSISLLGNKTGGDLHSEVLNTNHLGGARTGAGQIKLRLAPQGAPWEAGFSAGRDCASGDQEAYVLFGEIETRRVDVHPDLPMQYRRFYQHRCANSYAATGQVDWSDWRLGLTLGQHHMRSWREWPSGVGFPQFAEHWKQNSQEVRLATRKAAAGTTSARAWDAVFGLYRQEVKLARGYSYDMVVPDFTRVLQSASSNTSQSLAAYADVTWHTSERLDLTIGARASRDRAATSFLGDQMGEAFNGTAATRENTHLGHAAARWQWTPRWSSYVNVAQGYKPRGYNNAPSSLADAAGYGRERSTSYEIGSRYDSLQTRASMALYRIDSKDLQLYGDDDFGHQTLRNMGDSRSAGVEFNVEWDMSRQWTVSAGGQISHAQFRRIDAKACPDCHNHRIPTVPRHSLTLGAQGNLLWGHTLLRPQLHVRHTGSQYFDNRNTLYQPELTVVDAALAWHPHDSVELALYAHNLLDKSYRNYGYAGRTGARAQLAPGRTFGVVVTWSY